MTKVSRTSKTPRPNQTIKKPQSKISSAIHYKIRTNYLPILKSECSALKLRKPNTKFLCVISERACVTLRMLSLGFDRKQVISWRIYKGDKCHTRRSIIPLVDPFSYRREGLMFRVFLPLHLFSREKCQKRRSPQRHLLSVDTKFKNHI